MTAQRPQTKTDLSLTDVINRLDDLVGQGEVSVRDVLDGFGPTAFLPILMVPALLVASPLSGIPLFSSLCGIAIALVAAQLLLGRDRLWLPDAVLRRRVDADDMHGALSKMRKGAGWLDRHTHRRFGWLTGSVGQRVVFAACMIAGLTMPFLEIIPFSSSLMGLAVLLCALGLLAVDGLFILLGFVLMTCVAMIPVAVYSGISGLLSGVS